MIGDLFTEWRAHLSERLSNPVLGPFTAGWVAWNWRFIAVLFFSDKSIEEKITYIDANYIGLTDLLLVPALFALAFAILMPWVTLGMQHIQDGAISRRKRAKLKQDTDYLRASIDRAEAQAALNGILAQDEIARRQKQELEARQAEIEHKRSEAAKQLEEAEAELERQRHEYEARSDKDNEAAKAQREELDRLKAELISQQERSEMAMDAARRELEERRRELDRRSDKRVSSTYSDKKLIEFLVMGAFRLYHNPAAGMERSKIIRFDRSGRISRGRNSNEHSWRVENGRLELVQADGEVHSRFHYIPESKIFLLTGDSDLKSAPGQFIIPEVPKQTKEPE